MAVATVTDVSFDSEVKSAETVLVDFWASWCPPCKRIAPVLEELEQEIPNVKIVKLNVDDDPETASRFQVMSLPTLILFKNGQPVDKLIGFTPKQTLADRVSRHL